LRTTIVHQHEPYGLTASIVQGILVPRDAMSNVVRQNADALQALPQGCRVRIFTLYSEVADNRVTLVSDPASLAADPFFRASNIIVFHFGIRYPLFPAIQLAPRTAKTVGFFFGVTPPHLVAKHERDTIAESYRQMSYLHAADQVVITADSLRKELLPIGLPAEKLVKVPLSAWVRRPESPPRLPSESPRLICVSRFVPAKGTLDLLRAFRLAVASGADLHLDLVGSLKFSDKTYLEQLAQYAIEQNLSKRVQFHYDPNDQELAALYSRCDALVSPSHHEGFGVAVAEAVAAGCFVITTDAGALPETSGGLGLVYPSGSAEQLAEKLISFAKASKQNRYPTQDGRSIPRSEWRELAAKYAETMSGDAYAERFRTAVMPGVRPLPDGFGKFLAESSRSLLKGSPLASEATATKQVYEKLDAQFQQLRTERTAQMALKRAG
jgi:glycosyltransferase involved in cell wall biosynthesis